MKILKSFGILFLLAWGNNAYSDLSQEICDYLGKKHNAIERLRTDCKYPIIVLLQRSGANDLVPLWESGINNALRDAGMIQSAKEKVCNTSRKRDMSKLKKYVQLMNNTISQTINHLDVFREATSRDADCSRFKKIKTRNY